MTKIYAEDNNIYIFGVFDKDQIIGFIVIKTINKQYKAYEIIYIAVNKHYRKLGIASKLIDYIIKNFNMLTLKAETDEEAVGFYKKYGFNIKIGNKIENTIRYKCEYRLKG